MGIPGYAGFLCDRAAEFGAAVKDKQISSVLSYRIDPVSSHTHSRLSTTKLSIIAQCFNVSD